MISGVTVQRRLAVLARVYLPDTTLIPYGLEHRSRTAASSRAPLSSSSSSSWTLSANLYYGDARRCAGAGCPVILGGRAWGSASGSSRVSRRAEATPGLAWVIRSSQGRPLAVHTLLVIARWSPGRAGQTVCYAARTARGDMGQADGAHGRARADDHRPLLLSQGEGGAGDMYPVTAQGVSLTELLAARTETFLGLLALLSVPTFASAKLQGQDGGREGAATTRASGSRRWAWSGAPAFSKYVASPLETAPFTSPSHADWVSTHSILICMGFFLLFGLVCGFYKLLEICKEARKMRPKDPEMGQVFRAQPFQAPQIAAPPKVAISGRGRPVVHTYVSMDEVLRGHRCVLV
ncbi:hypothetical protein FB45DRAFT_1030312 [Roridomyces roridus]|uniref:Uncharacterized protein n=1 Tax=Roridomyces roridus TaxID=1738132 RepID=A0AAD7BP03_9AGAR|nr:hypothetical protein FB45DRAFT_1030312 [Roridomyces roridus]